MDAACLPRYQVLYNDDCPTSSNGVTSCVTLTAGSDQDFSVQVYGYGAASGALTLLIAAAPANDDFANRQAIPTGYMLTGG